MGPCLDTLTSYQAAKNNRFSATCALVVGEVNEEELVSAFQYKNGFGFL